MNYPMYVPFLILARLSIATEEGIWSDNVLCAIRCNMKKKDPVIADRVIGHG